MAGKKARGSAPQFNEKSASSLQPLHFKIERHHQMSACSCGGSNENCCWCFGTGIIGPDDQRNLSPCSPAAGPTEAATARFDYNAEKVFLKRTDETLRALPTAAAQPSIVHCLICKMAFRGESILSRHVHDAHEATVKPITKKLPKRGKRDGPKTRWTQKW